MTETLSTLSREQLQKLVQYAINEDPGGVLGKVFRRIGRLDHRYIWTLYNDPEYSDKLVLANRV